MIQIKYLLVVLFYIFSIIFIFLPKICYFRCLTMAKKKKKINFQRCIQIATFGDEKYIFDSEDKIDSLILQCDGSDVHITDEEGGDDNQNSFRQY